ncbi:hypothetical protein [Dactylosporangium sp. NPDC051541]|uniref:hypothetical protein n=1 Tax=Dactylosporangium sp. NPDC051541 TaxID=3363977 RepID=UPI0037BD1007
MSKSLTAASQDACAAALRRRGFVAKRRRLLIHPRPDPGVTGWLGLNLATWSLPETLHVNPVIGVRHLPVEKALDIYGRHQALGTAPETRAVRAAADRGGSGRGDAASCPDRG